MEIKYILDIIYLVASVTFVLGLKMLSHPDSARKGNLYAAFGMTLAIIGTILLYNQANQNHIDFGSNRSRNGCWLVDSKQSTND